MAKYLDEEGLKHLWSKIEENFVDHDEQTEALKGKLASGDIAMNYTDGKIVLTAGGVECGSIDAAPFIKDGMLDDVEVITVTDDNKTELSAIVGEISVGEKLIRFEWNMEGDDAKVDYIRVTDIAVDPNTSNTETTKAIKLKGGPLAETCKAAFGESIPAGTSVQELLEKLFYSENWSTVSVSNGASSVGSNALTVGMTLTKSGVQAVGTKATVNNPTVSQSNKSASASISGFDYEYYSLDGSTKTKGTSVSKSWTYSTEAPSVSITSYAGFGLSAVPAVGDELTVAIGTNSVTATGVGASRTASCDQVGPVYDVSNEGNIADDESRIYKIEAQSKTVSAPSNKTATASITGVYPVYTNESSNNNLTNATVEKVEDASVFTITYGAENGNHNMFVYPASHTLSKVEVFNPNAPEATAWGEYIGGKNISDVKKTVNGVEYDYKEWKRVADAVGYTESTKFRFTLSKKTSKL